MTRKGEEINKFERRQIDAFFLVLSRYRVAISQSRLLPKRSKPILKNSWPVDLSLELTKNQAPAIIQMEANTNPTIDCQKTYFVIGNN